MRSGSHTRQMTAGSPLILIVTFALPLMFGNICQQLYTVVDSMVVGRTLGVSALASLGVTSWPYGVIIGMAMALAQGISIRMAHAFGKQDIPALKDIFGNAILLAGSFALFLTLVSQILTLPILRLLGTAEELQPAAALYLRVIYAGIPITMAYNLLAGALRALGNSRTPLIAMAVSSVINVLLDLFFVAVLGWGIAGAALATLMAQCFAVLICLREVRRIPELGLTRLNFRVRPDYLKGMAVISTPMVLQNFLIALGGMAVQSVVNSYNVVFVAGFTAGSKMHGVLEIATSSFGFAITTYVAQNLGAARIDRIHKGVRASFGAALATACTISLIMLLIGRWLLSGFVSGSAEEVAATVDVAYRYLTYMCLFLPVLYLLYVFRSSLQGLGNTVLPMVSAFAEFCMRISFAMLLARLIGQDGVLLAEVAAWCGADVVLITSYIFCIRRVDRKYGYGKENLSGK